MEPDELDRVVGAAQRGDRRAFDEIMMQLQGDLRLYLSAFEVTPSLVEEILQAAFVTAYYKLPTYEARGTFRAWLKGIARNHLLKELRERRRFVETSGDRLDEILVQHGLEQVECAQEIEAHTRRLFGCLSRLPGPYRELVEGRYLRQEPLALLSERFRRSEVWVRVTLFRIRRLLRTCMEAEA
jgi:RNA polymerase sigma-70 factor, ECF subfamily